MRWFRRWPRRGRLPVAVRTGLSLRPGERVIAYAAVRDGGHVAATDRALHLPDGHAIGWERIDHASWEGGWLHLREHPNATAERPGEHHLRLSRPGTLPQAVRERITATILVSRYARLHGDRGVRIVARRPPGSGEVMWSLIFDPGLDPHDPALRATAERMLHDVRQQTGV